MYDNVSTDWLIGISRQNVYFWGLSFCTLLFQANKSLFFSADATCVLRITM